MSQRAEPFALFGGLDLVTPALRTAPGFAIAGNNYEPEARGYARIGGFERLDGKPKPSLANYHTLDFDAGDTAILADDVITGGTSGATGIVLYDVTPITGTFAGGDATGEIIVLNLTGEFIDNEAIQVSAVTIATTNGIAVSRGADTDAVDTTYYRAAIEHRRDLIAKPTGAGPVRGTWVFNGVYYCFRDNVGQTAGQFYKSTATGWVLLDLGRSLAFISGGTVETAEGDTITGATSGATATVERVIVTSGTFAGGDAAGHLILSGQTGTFTAETLDIGASVNVANVSADSAAIVLPPGGKYRFKNHNFYGASDLRRMYGVNGESTSFEFDGSVFVPILTGMVDDRPTHIAVHREHLFFGFRGGSLQHSGVGDPLAWTPLLGAGELGMGDDITNILSDTDTAMTILTTSKVGILFGNSSADWVLKILNDEAGGIEDTAQRVGKTVWLDNRGIRTLAATQDFGDFKMGSSTQLIEPLFRLKQKQGITPVGSIPVTGKDQYRVFFSDGTGVTIYYGRKMPEALPFNLGFTVSCVVSAENSDGSEILLAGSSDGWVYELDAGTSFDGGEVAAFIRLAFNHLRSPNYRKRFHKATFEVDVIGPIVLGIIAEFGYADPNQPPSALVSTSLAGGGGFWDEVNWDEFFWSAPLEGLAEAPIDGLGRNVSITAVSNGTYELPHVLQGLIINYSLRGLVR
jgi:hypothetical protein